MAQIDKSPDTGKADVSKDDTLIDAEVQGIVVVCGIEGTDDGRARPEVCWAFGSRRSARRSLVFSLALQSLLPRAARSEQNMPT